MKEVIPVCHGSLMKTSVPSGVPSPIIPVTTRMWADGAFAATHSGPKSSSICLNDATEKVCGGSGTSPQALNISVSDPVRPATSYCAP